MRPRWQSSWGAATRLIAGQVKPFPAERATAAGADVLGAQRVAADCVAAAAVDVWSRGAPGVAADGARRRGEWASWGAAGGDAGGDAGADDDEDA